MKDRTLKALQGSIQKWEDIIHSDGQDSGYFNCPLCSLFYNRVKECEGCPVKDKVGEGFCRKTPYRDWATHQQDAHGLEVYNKIFCEDCIPFAQAEIDFLKALLPEGTEDAQTN